MQGFEGVLSWTPERSLQALDRGRARPARCSRSLRRYGQATSPAGET